MADIRPFRGVTYDPARVALERVLCPPYDVINEKQQAAYYARDPHNYVRVVLNQSAGDARYSDAAASLSGWLDDCVLRRSDRPALYVHRHTFETTGGTATRVGIIAAVRLEPWDARRVRRHEHTMAGPKEDRLALARATSADVEPIWVFYPDPEALVESVLQDVVATPPSLSADFRAEPLGDEPVAAERNEIWEVTDVATQDRLLDALATLPLYIADGHHRYETALSHADEAGGGADDATRFKVMLLTSQHDPGLIVLPTHRLVKLPIGRTLDAMQSQLHLWGWKMEPQADLAQLRAELGTPAGEDHLGFGLYAGGAFTYMEGMVASPDVELLHPSIADLDVAVLHQGILKPLLGLGEAELAAGDWVAYSREPAEVVARVDSGDFQAGFFLRPPALIQVKHVADADQSMPQKSTYFWPKPPSGMVLALQHPGEAL